MTRLILDAMGGDHGPSVILEGILEALPELKKDPGELVVIGDQTVIESVLSKRRFQPVRAALESSHSNEGLDHSSSFRIRIIHSTQTIDMEDSIKAIRSKPDATINVGCELAAQSYLESKKGGSQPPMAFISAGNSGALMASALLHMGRLPKLERPAIAAKLPNLSPHGCILIDVGANVDCKPEQMRDFAIMGAIYAQVERKGSFQPRLALLSNGEERKKGNELTRASATLIEKLPCFSGGKEKLGQFLGYVEGKEIFKGDVDVVITDGFVGNVVLKSVEAVGSAIASLLKSEGRKNPFATVGFLLSSGVFRTFRKKLDYAETGAAPLLGVKGYAFVCHGRSNPKAIKNALLHAKMAIQEQLVERLEEALTKNLGS